MEIISRAEAKAQGLKRYFTGRPCKHGHVCERAVHGGCIECRRGLNRAPRSVLRKRQWREANKVRLKEADRARYAAAKKHRATYNKEYYEANKGRVKAQQKIYREANKEKIKASRTARFEANQATVRRSRKAYALANRERISAAENSRYARRQENDLSFILWRRATRAVRKLPDRDGRPWAALFGFTPDELARHFEAQFTEGMTFEEVKSGEVTLDHIIPISAFSICSVNDPHFRDCFGLQNLRPMWNKDNIRKGNKRGTEWGNVFAHPKPGVRRVILGLKGPAGMEFNAAHKLLSGAWGRSPYNPKSPNYDPCRDPVEDAAAVAKEAA